MNSPMIEIRDKEHINQEIFDNTNMGSIRFVNIGKLTLPNKILLFDKLTFLDLNKCFNNNIPESVFKIKSLKTLFLFNNQMNTIPNDIINLKNLEILSLADNNLKKIPDIIYQMTRLSSLSLDGNPLIELSSNIAKLSNLTTLTLGRTDLMIIPNEIIKLDLTFFDISRTFVFNLDDNIKKWTTSIKICRENPSIEQWMFKIISKEIENNFARRIIKSCDIELHEKTLEIKKSTIENAGDGVFALEDIPAGTIFKPYELEKKINDLAWNNNIDDYLSMDYLNNKINTVVVIETDMPELLFFGEYKNTYLMSMKNIKKGEELSRLYGLEYWVKLFNLSDWFECYLGRKPY